MAVHPTQSPAGALQREVDSRGCDSGELRRSFTINPTNNLKNGWRLHDAWSPSRNDSDCAGIYDHQFPSSCRAGERAAIASDPDWVAAGAVLEARLMALLANWARTREFLTLHAMSSLALVLTAEAEAKRAVPAAVCAPLLCDVALADDLPAVL